MRAERRKSGILGGVLGFIAAFAGIGTLVTGMRMQDISMVTVAVVCAVAAGLFAFGANYRIFSVTPGALALWGLWLWFKGNLKLSVESLLYQLSRMYDLGYGCGIIQWSEEPPAAADATLVLCALGVLTALVVTWSVVRGKSVWLAIAACITPVIPCMILTDTIPHGVYLFLQIVCLLLLLLPWMIRKRDARQGNTLTALMAVPVAIALAVLFWCMPKDSYHGLTFLDNGFKAAEQLLTRHVQQENTRPTLPRPEGSWVDLTIVGPRQSSMRTVMEVEAQQTGILYLKGETFDVYRGVWWDVRGPEVPPAGVRLTEDRVVTITTKAMHEMLYLPYGAIRISNSASRLTESKGRTENDGPWRRYSIVYGDMPTYTESWQLPAGDVPAQYTQLDEKTLLAAQELLRRELPELETTAGVWDRANMITNYVKNSARYSLYTDKMPDTAADFALWFLEDSDTGYCVHFATAATVLLRAAGIPARYVTGYLVSAKEGQTVSVPQKSAHAWTECYINGVGWVPLEPTPASGVAQTANASGETVPTVETTVPVETTPSESATQPQQTTAATEAETLPQHTETKEPETTQPTQNTGGRPNSGSDTPGQASQFRLPGWLKRLLWLTAGAIAAVAAVIGQWRLRVKLRMNKRSRGGRNAQVLARWQEVVLHCRIRKIQPEESLSQLAQKAKFSQYTLTREEMKLFDAWLNGSKGTIMHMGLRQHLLATLVYALY